MVLTPVDNEFVYASCYDVGHPNGRREGTYSLHGLGMPVQ